MRPMPPHMGPMGHPQMRPPMPPMGMPPRMRPGMRMLPPPPGRFPLGLEAFCQIFYFSICLGFPPGNIQRGPFFGPAHPSSMVNATPSGSGAVLSAPPTLTK